MSILISCGKLKLNVISIYAPNMLRSRKEFYRNLHEYFFTGCQLIIGGDFNCVDSNLDKYGGNSDMGFTGKDEVAKLKRDFFLNDIWRTKNKRTRQFTWFNSNASIACRLDKFLISKDLVDLTRLCDIQPCHFSDHDFVNLTLDTRTFWNRGPGVWRLNTSILSDPNYEKLMNDFFDKNPRPTNGTPLGQWWDYLKNQIKSTTVSYCKEKKRASRNERHRLTLQLIKAKQRLTDGDNSAFKEVKNLENELKILNLNELGVKIRTRSQ